jgi:hypothetical protein
MRVFILLIIAGLLTGCEKGESIKINKTSAGGYSVFVSNGQVLISGYISEKDNVVTKFWINGKNADQSEFEDFVENGGHYRQSVDENSRIVYTFKDQDGVFQNYQFDQGSLSNDGKIFYYKNNSIVNMGNDSIGTISSVAFHNGAPFFAGYLGEITQAETGLVLRPVTPFIWDGGSSMVLLTLPEQVSHFAGISAISMYGQDKFYVGGLCGFPMYWYNHDPIVLDDRYGEVWQVLQSGADVYAVGLMNKYNSNSTGHTACYWKNGDLYELEDNAQAYGIFVDGADIYVTGSFGRVPANYRPCYWKNGIRTDLPM